MTTLMAASRVREAALDELRAAVTALTARDAQRADELAALRVEVGALKVALHLRGHDRDGLQVSVDAFPYESFTVQALLERAERQRPLQLALAGLSARSIGARLRRLARQPLPGFTLTLDGKSNVGCIWSLSHLDPCDRGRGGV
jgi:hypothetical protein